MLPGLAGGGSAPGLLLLLCFRRFQKDAFKQSWREEGGVWAFSGIPLSGFVFSPPPSNRPFCHALNRVAAGPVTRGDEACARLLLGLGIPTAFSDVFAN